MYSKINSAKLNHQTDAGKTLYTGALAGGTVLDTKGEMIKVHLDIDDKQEQEEAYWFEYKPAVGNVFPVMPQIGTTTLLQLNRNYGGSGLVTHVIHQTAQEQSEMADYNRRYFTTEFKKRLAMVPELLDFKNKEKNHHLELADAKGITASTTSMLKIIAEEDIIMGANKNITAYSPEKVYMTKVVNIRSKITEEIGYLGRLTHTVFTYLLSNLNLKIFNLLSSLLYTLQGSFYPCLLGLGSVY